MNARTRQALAGWSLAAPALAVIALFFFVPVVAGLCLSLTDFDIYALADLRNLRFVALDNYTRLLQQSLFWTAMGNSVYFVGVGVPLSVGLSLAAAVLLESRLARFKPLWRTALFAPMVTTVVAVAVVWRYLVHVKYGLFNEMLVGAGLSPVDWLGDPRWSMPTVIAFAAWKNLGGNMIILIAALQAIPQDLHEAARMDGAGPWARFRHVTLPGVAPTLLLVTILTTAGYFQLFAEPYVMTQGGPLDATKTLVFLIYESAFVEFEMGYASAIGVVLFAITLVLSLLNLRALRELRR